MALKDGLEEHTLASQIHPFRGEPLAMGHRSRGVGGGTAGVSLQLGAAPARERSRSDAPRLCGSPQGPSPHLGPRAAHSTTSCGLRVYTSVNLQNPCGVGWSGILEWKIIAQKQRQGGASGYL